MSSMDDADRRDEERSATGAVPADELERASENVLGDWPAGASEIQADEPNSEEAPDAAEQVEAAPLETEVNAARDFRRRRAVRQTDELSPGLASGAAGPERSAE